jgi:pilus assembly protein FimV
MLRKSSLAMAVALALAPVVGLGLGLGEMRSSSGLNQPFEAEIELLSVKQDEIDQVKIDLASPEAFAKAGIERGYHLTKLAFKPFLRPDGRMVIRVSSSEPMREPYLNFLVEVNWAQGRVVREYTVLLDPPTYTGRRGAPVQAARAAPRPAASGAPEAAVGGERQAAAAVRLSGEAYGPVGRGETLWSIANRVKPAGSTTHQAMTAIVRANPGAFVGGDMNRMLAGATLKLPVPEDMGGAAAAKREPGEGTAAAGRQPAGAAESTTRGASDQLRLAAPTPAATPARGGPSPSDVQKEALLAQEKVESVRQTTEQLQGRVGELEAQLRDMHRLILLKDAQLAQLQDRAPAATPVAPTPPPAPAAAPAAPVVAPAAPAPVEPVKGGTWVAPGAETPPVMAAPATIAPATPPEAVAPPPIVAEKAPVPEVAPAPLPEAKAAEPKAPEPVTAAAPPVAPAPAADSPRAPEPPKVAEAPPPAPVEPPKAAAPVAPPKAEPPRLEPAPAVATVREATPQERKPRDVWESVLQDPTTLVGAGVAGVGVLGALIWGLASRRKTEEPEETEPAAEPEKPTPVLPEAAPVAEAPVAAAPIARPPEPTPVVAPATVAAVPPVAPAPPPPAAPAAPVAPVAAAALAAATATRGADADRVSTEDLAALDLSTTDLFGLKDETTEVDPTEEADVYIAYGRFEQAEQLLKLALEMEPNRLALQHKLLEVYFAARDAGSFGQLFGALKAAGKDSIDPAAWQRALRMGRQLEAANPLYAAVGAAAATAGAASTTGTDDLSSALLEAQRELAAELERTSTQPPTGRPDTSTVTPSRMTTESTFDEMDMGSVMNDLSLDLGTQDVGGGPDKTHPFQMDVSEELKRADAGIRSALGPDTSDVAVVGLKEGDTSQVLETELSLATDTDQYQESMSSGGPDLSNIQLNLESPLTGSPEQDTTLVHSDTTLELVDDVETKLDLARAYIELGDKDSARNLLDEVLQEGSDEQKATAQGMLTELT